jgi:hypothetical protein
VRRTREKLVEPQKEPKRKREQGEDGTAVGRKKTAADQQAAMASSPAVAICSSRKEKQLVVCVAGRMKELESNKQATSARGVIRKGNDRQKERERERRLAGQDRPCHGASPAAVFCLL